MGTINMFNMTRSALEEEFQKVKNILLDQLCEDEVITEETKEDYQKHCAVLLRKPSFFSKLLKKNDECFNLIVVRIVSEIET